MPLMISVKVFHVSFCAAHTSLEVILNNPVVASSGKSALHWAAAVNNVEAAIVLLKNGANKDMQNNKV